MKLRIKYMYEAGGTSAFESLVRRSFGFVIMPICQNVPVMTDKSWEFGQDEEKIETLKSDLEKDQKEIESKQAEYEEKGNNLDAMITSKSAEVANLDAQIRPAGGSRG